jgi:hypothetical protein
VADNQLVCKYCLNAADQPLSLDSLNLRPEAILDFCTGSQQRKQTEAHFEKALTRIKNATELLRQRVREGMPQCDGR